MRRLQQRLRRVVVAAGLLARFRRLARLVRPSPEAIVRRANGVVLDMNAALVEAKKEVATVIADEKRLARRVELERTLAAEWETRAERALGAGRPDLAEEARARRDEHLELAALLRSQWSAQSAIVEEVKRKLRALTDVVDEAKRRRWRIEARVHTDRARRVLADVALALDAATEVAEELERAASIAEERPSSSSS